MKRLPIFSHSEVKHFTELGFRDLNPFMSRERFVVDKTITISVQSGFEEFILWVDCIEYARIPYYEGLSAVEQKLDDAILVVEADMILRDGRLPPILMESNKNRILYTWPAIRQKSQDKENEKYHSHYGY